MVPLGSEGAVTMVRPATIVMVNCFVPVTLLASETWTVKVVVPLAEGVPEMVGW